MACMGRSCLIGAGAVVFFDLVLLLNAYSVAASFSLSYLASLGFSLMLFRVILIWALHMVLEGFQVLIIAISARNYTSDDYKLLLYVFHILMHLVQPNESA